MNRYAVAGAGMQGTAAAYDLGVNGNAESILLLDANRKIAENSAELINKLLQKDIACGKSADAKDVSAMNKIMKDDGIGTIVSAMHYGLNKGMTDVALQTGANMIDLGGHTGIVKEQQARTAEAKNKGVTIVPDCGMGPGLNISLGMYAMSLLDEPRELYIFDGGLPQNPMKPWNYAMTFNIRGLTNEYAGDAYFIRNGKVQAVPALTEIEDVEFPRIIGTLEAAVTSGGLSTAPWTQLGKLQKMENKTLRYPGHWDKMKAFEELGLFSENALYLDGTSVVPRSVLHALLGPQITRPNVRDIGVIRINCVGKKGDNDNAQATVQLIDSYDHKTGFTAMQRLTGWHASTVAILAAENKLPKGVLPVESIDGALIADEMKRRGFHISQEVR